MHHLNSYAGTPQEKALVMDSDNLPVLYRSGQSL